MTKSHYDVLGLDSDATPEEIRTAYRREAKRLHPDHYDGAEGSAPFRAAREAYEVLCDPQQRCAYDNEQNHPSSGLRRPPQPRPQYRSRWRPPVEPLIPEMRASAHPTWERPPDRTEAGRTEVQARQPLSDVHLDLILSPALVRYGGAARMTLPVRAPCRHCRGQGHTLLYACPACYGRGVVDRPLVLDLMLPAGLQEGETLRVSLAEAGLPAVMLVMQCYWG